MHICTFSLIKRPNTKELDKLDPILLPHTQQLVGSPFASEVMTSSTCLLCMLYMWKLAFSHIIGTSFAYVHYLHAVYIWYICILFFVLELKFNKMDQWVKSSRWRCKKVKTVIDELIQRCAWKYKQSTGVKTISVKNRIYFINFKIFLWFEWLVQ